MSLRFRWFKTSRISIDALAGRQHFKTPPMQGSITNRTIERSALNCTYTYLQSVNIGVRDEAGVHLRQVESLTSIYLSITEFEHHTLIRVENAGRSIGPLFEDLDRFAEREIAVDAIAFKNCGIDDIEIPHVRVKILSARVHPVSLGNGVIGRIEAFSTDGLNLHELPVLSRPGWRVSRATFDVERGHSRGTFTITERGHLRVASSISDRVVEHFHAIAEKMAE